MKLHQAISARFHAMIDEGVIRVGEKIPSIRQASQQFGVSISTISKAYELLEREGVIESRPQSGYYVAYKTPLKQKKLAPVETHKLSQAEIVLTTLRAIKDHGTIPLGSPYPDPTLFPIKKLLSLQKSIEPVDGWSQLQELPPGNELLRQAISREYLVNGLSVLPTEIVITHGATEAIVLALQAVAKAGDAIAIEAPGYYALALAIERLGMKPIEVPTDPNSGIEIDALLAVMQNIRISAVIITTNFQNPLGFVMPDNKKKALAALLNEYSIPLIEDDVYAPLHFEATAPLPVKAYDTEGRVLHIGSFSKHLAPGIKVGWISAGQYRAKIEQLLFANSVSMPSAPQIAISKFLGNQAYQKHLRKLRHHLKSNATLMKEAIEQYFPEGTRYSTPKGGYVIWLELPRNIDALTLYQLAIQHHISIAPGPVFTRSRQWTNALRLNFSYAWTPEIEEAIQWLGTLATSMS